MPLQNPTCARFFKIQAEIDNGTGLEWTNIALLKDLNVDFSKDKVGEQVKDQASEVPVPNCAAPISASCTFTALYNSSANVDAVTATVNDASVTQFEASSQAYGLFFAQEFLSGTPAQINYRIVDGSAVAFEFEGQLNSYSLSSDISLEYAVGMDMFNLVINAASV